MEIIIGRDPGNRRLHCVADGRDYYIGQPGSVPQSVSRTHCKITWLNGQLKIENISDHNVTLVDGNRVFSKVITATNMVQLGKDEFTLPLTLILREAGVSLAQPPVQPPVQQSRGQDEYVLNHLEAVWQQYDGKKQEIIRQKHEEANKQRIMSYARLALMGVGSVAAAVSTGELAIAFACIAGLIGVVSLVIAIRSTKDEPIQTLLAAVDEEFATMYKCPNPDCGRPFGVVPFRQVKFIKRWPACGCSYSCK